MNRTEMTVTMIASLGWLFLATRAFRSRVQSFERTALMAVCWTLLFAVIAVVAAQVDA